MELLESVLHSFVNLAMLLFEYIGVGVITFAGIQGIVNYIRRKPETRLVLAQGLAMGLEFKLGSEILRTVVVRSLSEIAIVGSIIALRAVLTILIHWEIKNEKNEEGEIYAARKKETKASKAFAADSSESFPEPVLDADLIDSLGSSDDSADATGSAKASGPAKSSAPSAKASSSAKSSGASAKASGSAKSSGASVKASDSAKSSGASAKASGSAKSSNASYSSSPYAPLRPVEELDDSFFTLPKASDKDN